MSSDQDKYATDCTPDGRHLIFYTLKTGGTGCDLWLVPLAERGMKVASESLPFGKWRSEGGRALLTGWPLARLLVRIRTGTHQRVSLPVPVASGRYHPNPGTIPVGVTMGRSSSISPETIS